MIRSGEGTEPRPVKVISLLDICHKSTRILWNKYNYCVLLFFKNSASQDFLHWLPLRITAMQKEEENALLKMHLLISFKNNSQDYWTHFMSWHHYPVGHIAPFTNVNIFMFFFLDHLFFTSRLSCVSLRCTKPSDRVLYYSDPTSRWTSFAGR